MKGYYIDTNSQFKSIFSNTLLGRLTLSEVEQTALDCQNKGKKEWEICETFVGFRLGKPVLHICIEDLSEGRQFFVKIASNRGKVICNNKDVALAIQEKIKEKPQSPVSYRKPIYFPQDFDKYFKGTVLSMFTMSKFTKVLNKSLPGGSVEDLYYEKKSGCKALIASVYYKDQDALKTVEIFAGKKGLFCRDDELEDRLNNELSNQAKILK